MSSTSFQAIDTQTSIRHFRWIGVAIAALWLLVIGINLAAFQIISAPENQRILQNNVGWERTYKPMIFDRLQPQVAVFGASWARDAFDYEEISALLGKRFFNHAVSGGQPYENRRFLQNALHHDHLDTVILHVSSFLSSPRQLKFQYGFNEGLLAVDADGKLNRQTSWHRFFAKTLSGAAVGNNLSAMQILRRFKNGQAKQQLLRAYDRFDFSKKKTRQALWAAMLAGQTTVEGKADPIDSTLLPNQMRELENAVLLACEKGVAVKAYMTPAHPIITNTMANESELRMAIWARLKTLQPRCPKGLEYWDFAYPNAMTLEGLQATDTTARYFRADGHPRPTVGQIMASQMFGRVFFEQPLRDMGVDLLQLDRTAANQWLSIRQQRWAGKWNEHDRLDVLKDLETSRRHGLK